MSASLIVIWAQVLIGDIQELVEINCPQLDTQIIQSTDLL